MPFSCGFYVPPSVTAKCGQLGAWGWTQWRLSAKLHAAVTSSAVQLSARGSGDCGSRPATVPIKRVFELFVDHEASACFW